MPALGFFSLGFPITEGPAAFLYRMIQCTTTPPLEPSVTEQSTARGHSGVVPQALLWLLYGIQPALTFHSS